MYHGILKENQVHNGVDIVVRLQSFLKNIPQGLPRGDSEVLGVTNTSGKMAVDKRLCFQNGVIQILPNNEFLCNGTLCSDSESIERPCNVRTYLYHGP